MVLVLAGGAGRVIGAAVGAGAEVTAAGLAAGATGGGGAIADAFLAATAATAEPGVITMVWDGSGTGGELKGQDRLLNRPWGIDFDAGGRLYIADTYNSRIILVTL